MPHWPNELQILSASAEAAEQKDGANSVSNAARVAYRVSLFWPRACKRTIEVSAMFNAGQRQSCLSVPRPLKIGSPFGASTQDRSNYRINRQPDGVLICTASGTEQIVKAQIRPAFAGYCFPPTETIGSNGARIWVYTPQPQAELSDTLEIEWIGSVLSCQSFFVSACMYTPQGHVTRRLAIIDDTRSNPPEKRRTYAPIIDSIVHIIQPCLVVEEEIALDRAETLEAALERLLSIFCSDPAVSVGLTLTLRRPVSAAIPGAPSIELPIAMAPMWSIDTDKASQMMAEEMRGAVNSRYQVQQPDLENASLIVAMTIYSSVSDQVVPILVLRNLAIAIPAATTSDWLGS